MNQDGKCQLSERAWKVVRLEKRKMVAGRHEHVREEGAFVLCLESPWHGPYVPD